MYTVYWIRHKDQTDIMSEGYVGITKNLCERIRGHRKSKHQTPLVTFLKSTDWLDVEIEMMDQNLSLKDALLTEAYYRPTQMVGLNLQMGGEMGVGPEWYLIPENREKHRVATSIATKIAIKKKDSKEARSARALKIHREKPDTYKGIQVGSRNGRATINDFTASLIKYIYIPAGGSSTEIAAIFGINRCVVENIRYSRSWKHI